MNLSIKFTVFGKVRGKERARKGKYGNWYTPPKTLAYQRLIGTLAFDEVRKFGGDASDALVVYNIRASETAYVEIWPHTKGKRHPDGDNVLKLVEDALKRACYEDDREVAGKHNLWQTGEDKLIVEVSWPETEE